jgi:gliding motility-associated-like protein
VCKINTFILIPQVLGFLRLQLLNCRRLSFFSYLAVLASGILSVEKELQIPKRLTAKPNLSSPIAGLLFLLLFFSYARAWAQLPDFTLEVVPTDETCLGNGTLTFNVTGTDPAATMIYTVYEMPNEATPIAVQNGNFLGNRTSGTYKVVATQIVGPESNTQTVFATINSAIVPLAYAIDSEPATCGPDGSMTISITAGIGAQYEIISGPVTRPLQTSPVFENLPAGVYEVRAFNNCGDGTVITHTITTDSVSLNIGDPTFPERMLQACDSILISNILSAAGGDVIAYPLSLAYTLHPPSGPDLFYTSTITSGGEDQAEALLTIPFYYGQLYFYDLTVTDACGNVFTRNDMPIQQNLVALVIAQAAECGQFYLSVSPAFYMPDYTIEFVSVPDGFVPTDFNAAHPGPFSDGQVSYGDEQHPVPEGTYVVHVHDACGHTSVDGTLTIDIDPPSVEHEFAVYPGCDGRTKVTVTITGFTVTGGTVLVAPPSYPYPLPDDVTDQVVPDEGLVLDQLLPGDYEIEVFDECGHAYPHAFTVPLADTYVAATSWPDCETGKGGIRISGSGTTLTQVVMTAAPPAFTQTLPYDASVYITPDGIFSMAGMPPGTYSFTVMDGCGQQNTANVNVAGYAVTASTFTMTPHCGSFDIALAHSSNGVSQSFWLQKFDPVTGQWGHPDTGVPYTEGTPPDPANSYLINNNQSTLSLIFLGQFRIIKRFQTMENGNVAPFKDCIEVLGEFLFTGEIEFTGIEKLTCDGESMDVRLYAIGVPPLHYSITQKDGQPFFVDNGADNLFTDLEPATYTFTVSDDCGNTKNFISDVAELPSLAQANQPGDLALCDDASQDGTETFDLSSQDAVVLGTQNPADFEVTYHASQADADSGSNDLPLQYTSGNATVYARLDYLNGQQCYDTVSFQLIVNPYPLPDMAGTWGLCAGQTTTITAPPGFDGYLWSTGAATQSITVSEGGIYTLEVTRDYPTASCTGEIQIEVIPSFPPVIQEIEIDDWTDNDNSITVVLDGTNSGEYLYSLDNVTFQESNVFDNLLPGPYTVYVKDVGECGSDNGSVYLLTYPKFFTPNGDGFNDTWQIKFSHVEPDMMTYIFDRYGKLITGFTPMQPGWDGTLNGHPLPSTDYWFVVIRQDGRELRGHFAMKR